MNSVARKTVAVNTVPVTDGGDPPTFKAVADHALLVEFGQEISDAANRSVAALDRALDQNPPNGLLEVVPAYVNLLLDFDPLLTDHDTLQAAVEDLLTTDHRPAPATATYRIPVCYDPTLAPDLEAIAAASGMNLEAVIAAHLTGDYRVIMYGFAPGYAYLDGVPPAIQIPRKPAAVRGVAAGSVIIAGPQCLITTLDMPTGWSVIGRSPTQILRSDNSRPFLFGIGDRLLIERVDLATYERLSAQQHVPAPEYPSANEPR